MTGLRVTLTLTFAVLEAGLFGWAVGSYWQLDAIRWYLTRLVPAAAIAHGVALVALLALGGAPNKDTYLVGMLLGLVVGLPVVALGTYLLQRYFDRVFRAKPAALRDLEHPQPQRVHPVLDPERAWTPGRRETTDDRARVVPTDRADAPADHGEDGRTRA